MSPFWNSGNITLGPTVLISKLPQFIKGTGKGKGKVVPVLN